jgi:TM2 domain-containing membrane protein YozV
MDRKEKDRELGQIAVDRGYITLINLEEALRHLEAPEYEDQSLLQYLVDNNLMTRGQVSVVIAKHRGVEVDEILEQQNDSAASHEQVSGQSTPGNVEDLAQFFKAKPGQINVLPAIILNFFIPGSGYFYLGKPQKAILMIVLALIFVWTIIVPFGVFVYSCVDAWNIVNSKNNYN